MKEQSVSSRGGRRWLEGLTVAFACCWGILAIASVDRLTWWAENVLLLTAWIWLMTGNRSSVFSLWSLGLIGLFLLLHAVGGHYTYPKVPLGNWLQHGLGLSRNPYDRVVHFSFGLLLTVPCREWASKRWPALGRAAILVPPVLLLAFSALYEIMEMWAAFLLTEDGAEHFLGMQGDPLDSVRDMEFALYGTLLATVLQLVWRTVSTHFKK